MVKLNSFSCPEFLQLFATVEYEAHINTNIDYSINHVFKTMSVAELNTLHTICEVERSQLLTILARSV